MFLKEVIQTKAEELSLKLALNWTEEKSFIFEDFYIDDLGDDTQTIEDLFKLSKIGKFSETKLVRMETFTLGPCKITHD